MTTLTEIKQAGAKKANHAILVRMNCYTKVSKPQIRTSNNYDFENEDLGTLRTSYFSGDNEQTNKMLIRQMNKAITKQEHKNHNI